MLASNWAIWKITRGGCERSSLSTRRPRPSSSNWRIPISNIAAERKQSDFAVLGDCAYETEYTITLRNHKESAVTVEGTTVIYRLAPVVIAASLGAAVSAGSIAIL